MTTVLPRDIAVGLAVGGYWKDISAYVYQADGLSITRGRSERGSQLGPSSCSLSLDNSDGRFIRRNPTGPYYGGFGRNTPLRVLVRTVIDTFTRTTSSGWGSTTTTSSGNSYAWTTAGSGGSVLAANWNVAAGVGTMSVPATNAHRRTMLVSPTSRDVDMTASFTLPVTNVTGGPIELEVTLRGITSPAVDYYRAKVTVEADESIKIGLESLLGGTITTAVTVAGLTHTSAQAIRIRAQAEGNTLRARVWQPGLTDEPDTWHVTGHNETLTAAGQPGIRVGVSSTNSNTLPFVVSCDSVEIGSPRFVGEVAEWPTERTSPTQSRAPIEAAGVTRRLGQGDAPEDSVLYRAITTQTNTPVAYWPCEDGASATSFASGIGGTPMSFSGTPDLASYTGFVASAPIPQLGDSSWAGAVPFYTATNETQVRFLFTLPAAGITDGARIMIFETSGTVRFWGLYWKTGGNLQITANAATGPEVLNSSIAFGATDITWRFSIELTQNGANIDYTLAALAPGASAGGASGTLAANTVGRVTGVFMGTNGGIALPTSVAFGHITVQSDIDSIYTLADELAAHDGETTGTRIQRLAGEEEVTFAYRGSLNATGMGPQLAAARLRLMQDAEYANQGLLGEARGDLALTFISRAALYNQAATLALDYSAGDLTGAFKAVDDDRFLRNDVTATRVDGSSERVTIDTGPMSVQSPPDGVGRYKDNPPAVSLTADSQVRDWAGWRALLGTVDQSRYPQIRLNLAAPTVGDRAMDLDAGDRLTIDNLTADYTYDQITQLVLGYTERLSTFEHTLVVNCTPETPYQVAEADLSGVKADSDASTLSAGVNSTATSLSVAVTDGTLWTTSSGLPLDITVGGERMTVTAISGASSPQTFTVTRSVNGVVKSQAAATAVQLFRRPTVAR
jgi:hypothetical protein